MMFHFRVRLDVIYRNNIDSDAVCLVTHLQFVRQ